MLEKIDIRCKFDPRTIAYVEAEANARGLDKCAVLREILDSWADSKERAFIETQKRLRARGLDGGTPGHRRAEDLWGDEE